MKTKPAQLALAACLIGSLFTGSAFAKPPPRSHTGGPWIIIIVVQRAGEAGTTGPTTAPPKGRTWANPAIRCQFKQDGTMGWVSNGRDGQRCEPDQTGTLPPRPTPTS